MGLRKIHLVTEETRKMVKSLDGFTASLLLKLVEFQPDPRASEKRAQRQEEPDKWIGPLDPRPRFDDWEYHKLLKDAVRPLADAKPYETARVLVDAVASMVRLRVYVESNGGGEISDISEIWCRRVHAPSRAFLSSEEDLVHTLTYACERVYELSADSVFSLNEALQNQPWTLFKRLREHLYARYPTEQTKPWIRELIINHRGYAESEHRYEFQQMVRVGCEHFGGSLLSQEERVLVFDAILSGPSQSHCREWLGDQYTDDLFAQRRQYFHFKQLKPFEKLLFGKYAEYFEELKAEHKQTLDDDDYSPISESRGGPVSYRSPKTKEELAVLSDTNLLTLINEWQEAKRSADDWLVEITISALAREFGSIFEGIIINDEGRLAFWMQHLRDIERPVYVRAIIEAGQGRIKSKQFEKLNVWLDVCEWILSHPDAAPTDGDQVSDESRETPDWHSARRAVADFLETCVQKEVSVPLSARDRIAKFLDELCTGFDWRLDTDRPVLLSRGDQLTEAINNTRSRALEVLLDFGYWVRRESGDTEAPVREVSQILKKRVTHEDLRLTLPEYAILGAQFGRIWDLARDWATNHKPLLFPKEEFRAWLEAFGNFLRYVRPFRPFFDLFREDFEFALENLHRFGSTGSLHPHVTDTLGEHLFTYYLWDVYPLSGDTSLLAVFYSQTENDKARWASLFDHVGRSLKNTGTNLAANLKERIVAFFDWRLAQGEPSELKEFTFWLEAPGLEPEWRLAAFSKILDVTKPDFALSMHIATLVEMLNEHTPSVLECFAKLTAKISSEQPFYIEREKAIAILEAGFQSKDPAVRENAARAKEQFLRAGRYDLLEVGQ